MKTNSKSVKLTEGKILLPLIIFAIPCIISNILQNLYNLADTAIVGQLIGLNSLAAVGATGSVVSLCITTITGLMSGFSIVAGKRLGAGQYSEVKKVFINAFAIVWFVGIVLTAVGVISAKGILKIMNTSPELMEEAVIYLVVIFSGIITTMLYNFFCEMLRAVGNSKMPLVFLAIASAIHIALNYLFMGAFKMGVSGAALSTVISQGMSAVMCFVYMYRKEEYFKIGRGDIKLDTAVMKECLKVGIPMATVNFVVNFGVLILQFVTNGIGTEYVAAYSGASKIGYIYTTPIFGFATALAVFASQNLGAGKPERIKSALKKGMALLYAVNTVILIFSLVCSKGILKFVVGDVENVINSGNLYLTIRMLSGYVLIPAACLKTVLPAVGRTVSVTISGFLEVAIRMVSPVLLVQTLGFIGVPLTDTLTWLVLAVFFIAAFPIEWKRVNKVN